MSTPNHEILLRLIALALVEIREKALEVEADKIFRLADLFHNVPLSLIRSNNDSIGFDLALNELVNRAEIKGLSPWLNAAKAHVQSSLDLPKPISPEKELP